MVQLKTLLSSFNHERITFLTGAGISTDSGIPDYRGPNGVYTRNKDFKPIQYLQFVSNENFRERYWSRSFLGWPLIQKSRPNENHEILSFYQKKFKTTRIITQNVDGLFKLVGADVLEMHGALRKVKCLSCHAVENRSELQHALETLNPAIAKWSKENPQSAQEVSSSLNPDGDSEINWENSTFKYPNCRKCNGMLKPDVVFFGENMKPRIRDLGFQYVEQSSALVVIGSSLQVYSALRLVKRAHDLKIPIVILNKGATRGDMFATNTINRNSIDELKTIKDLL